MNWILPERIDNHFPGHRAVVAVFAVITAMTIGRSLFHMFAPDGGAQSVAHIPLSTFSPVQAGQAVIFVFALWGLSQLIMGLLYVVALARYRALIPLLLVFIVVEYTGRYLLGHMRPLDVTHAPPGKILDHVMIPLALVLLFFSRPAFGRR
ncbi:MULTISPECIES: hypothetical protein [Xanthobacter]|jgi:hypothetical protein|uniref:hypothetical protein n=1 Tax=Xanthobacter TaxID=279 RepID=UPI001E585495|nr:MULTISPECIES: hypothetical protein [Xanthobacter]UDQ90460.1 hypothetical protein LJE71_05490 [Xanthobacter autotrophicus]UJX44801.1 hypothetical protein D7006_08760 [Xanthobacter sp. YC-JY1]